MWEMQNEWPIFFQAMNLSWNANKFFERLAFLFISFVCSWGQSFLFYVGKNNEKIEGTEGRRKIAENAEKVV